MSEYRISNMRVIKPSKALAEKHPDRYATVKGIFHDTDGNKLTIASKEITIEMALDNSTVIDLANGTLVVPSGTRGRKASASVSQAEIDSELEALRASASAN